MSVLVVPDMQIMQEANRLLMERFSPAKLVRLWAIWQSGGGDYLAWREEAFADATVDQLYEEIAAYQVSELISTSA
ncbi:MAG: hypothetical protein DWI57_10735 [Chloroflexi bacterium]|nr:MAG: hypothetical protein DWI57_10735 [Chloroflexota bacterium]